MFGLEYVLAFVNVAFKVAYSIVVTIPFRIAWNAIIPIYFSDYIPSRLHNIPFWHFAGILLIILFVGELIGKLVPKIVSIDNSAKTGL